MIWRRPMYYRNKPSFEGPEGIAKAIKLHFKFIRSDCYSHIYDLINKLIIEFRLENSEIESYSGNSFKLGDLGFYPKKGNLHIDAPEHLIAQVKIVADRIFTTTEIFKEYPEDEESTLIIELRPFGWH